MTLVWVLSLAVAVSAAGLAYAAIHGSAVAVARHRLHFTERAGLELRNLFLFVDPLKVYGAHVAVVVLTASLLWLFTGSEVVAAVSAAAITMAPRWLWRMLRQRRLDRIEAQLPDALLNLAGALRAGVSLSVAIQALVELARPPISQEFDLMLREQRLGVSVDESLSNLVRRVPIPTMTLAVSAIKIANETGGGLAETLEHTSKTLRSKFQVEGKIKALTAQGRFQGLVMGAMPLVVGFFLHLIEPQAMGKLWTTAIGWGVIAVIVAFQGLGFYMIRKIVDIDV